MLVNGAMKNARQAALGWRVIEGLERDRRVCSADHMFNEAPSLSEIWPRGAFDGSYFRDCIHFVISRARRVVMAARVPPVRGHAQYEGLRFRCAQEWFPVTAAMPFTVVAI